MNKETGKKSLESKLKRLEEEKEWKREAKCEWLDRKPTREEGGDASNYIRVMIDKEGLHSE